SLDEVFLSFRTKAFKTLTARKKFETVSNSLLQCILDSSEPCFLLPAVIDFISRVNSEKLLFEPYRMLQFEFWLNHYSNQTAEVNRLVRNKIVGKSINRDDYQVFFPIGRNKTLTGSHFVAAHLSPDVDTTIASFWGWVDAFGARVGSGVHYWALPGSVADSHTTMLFQKIFSADVFQVLARQTPALSLTALDLVCSKGILRLPISEHLSHLHAGRHIVAIDAKGHFKGDWRASDAVAVTQVTSAFYSLIRWLEHAIYYRLISAYAKPHVTKADIQNAMLALFDTKIFESEPFLECNDLQKTHVEKFIKDVLSITNGIKATYKELIQTLITFPEYEFIPEELFTKDGTLKEDRSLIFTHLETLFRICANASSNCRHVLERLDILLAIKDRVLGISSQFITLSSDVEEIRTKMNNLDYLTVAIPEEDGNWFPVGVVYANDIKRNPLGTVSLRDFSNENETKMAAYLEVVSIIDHHKSDIKTSSASTIIVGDAQSANTLVAELMLQLNVRYSMLGIPLETLEKERTALIHTPGADVKKLKRLLELTLNSQNTGSYIHPMREYSEYLFFLHAILDDTDLLTKVSSRDVRVVATLLNRMKSLVCKTDHEILQFDDIANDAHFTEKAAERILQHEDMYSIYQKIYAHKEIEVETNLAACVKGGQSTVFSDTKEQNGCSRIGQTKLFSKNFASFEQNRMALQKLWLDAAKKIYAQKPQLDLHMQMITTIASADEVYQGKSGNWKHLDELWIWVPPVPSAVEHLVYFLNAFSATEMMQQNDIEVQFLGPNYKDLDLIFSQNLSFARRMVSKEHNLPIAALRFKAGLLNSRKAFITPYLPRSI
ncbi:MAG: hypothetical protein LLF94_02980, partial [Chlamydiales bacterium]|nr:hypothetical protein [Chlamydiales bacterium]